MTAVAAGARQGLGRWVRPALGLVVAAVFLWLIARRVDWPAVSRLALSAERGFLALGLLALAAGFTVRIARWWLMLRALEPRVRFSACVRPFLVSLAVNNTVPLRAGDVVRAFGFRDALGVAPPRVLGTLVLERVLDLLVLLLVFFPGLLGVAAGVVPRGFVIAGAALGVACIAAVLTFVLAPGPISRLVSALLRWGPLARMTAAERAAGWAGQFFESFAPLGAPRLAMRLLLLSLLAWGLEGSMYAATAHAVGAHTAGGGPWFALATGTLATLLPSSPGYVGTFDYFAMLGLTAYGASRTAAAAFALLVHVVLWLPVTLAGGIAALWPRARAWPTRASAESA